MKRIQGVALFTVLITITLVMVLLGAFIGIQQSHSALSGNELTRQQLDQACRSAQHYAWYRLEEDSTWGTGAFAETTFTLEHGPDLVVTESPETITGRIPSSGASFEMEILNNIEGPDPQGEMPDLVPARSARIRVTASRGSHKRTLDCILRTHPFANQSLLSDGNILVDVTGVGQWNVESKDPYVNWVHSNKDIDGPSALQGRLSFEGPPRIGRASAVGEISLEGLPLSSDSSFRERSETASMGALSPDSAHVTVPELNNSQVEMPPLEVPLEAGEYEFRTVENIDWFSAEVMVEGVLETRWGRRTTEATAIVLTPEQGSQKAWLGETTVTRQETVSASSPTSPGVGGLVDLEPGAEIVEEDNSQPAIATSRGRSISADLRFNSLIIPPGTTATVNGDFTLSGEDRFVKPNLLLAVDGLDVVPELVDREDSVANPELYSAAMRARGNVTVNNGSVYGFGAISTPDDISLNSRSQLWSAPDLGVALRGDNVYLNPPLERANLLAPNQALPSDWELFDAALGDYVSEKLGGSWESIDDWLSLPPGERLTRTQEIGNMTIPGDKSLHWDNMKEAFDLSPNSSPDLSSLSGPMTLEHYIRMREYAKTEALKSYFSDDPEVEGDSEWLTGNDREINLLMTNQLSQYALFGDDSLSDYFAGEELPDSQDLFFRGLVYADGNLNLRARRNAIYFEGSVVTHGDLVIEDADRVETVYNRDFLDDILNLYPDNMTKLDQIYLIIR